MTNFNKKKIEKVRRYVIEICYHGGSYHGWQKQKNATGIQNVVEDVLMAALGEYVSTLAAGRTDTGVHANQQFVQFDTTKEVNQQMVYKLNAMLPGDIFIKNIFGCSEFFNVRHSAIKREYVYRLSREKDPFLRGLVGFYFSKNIRFDVMNEACTLLLKHVDYQCFSSVKTDVNHFICHIYYACWQDEGKEWIFTIKANRFLRGMVRTIVGTLLDVGKGKLSVDDFEKIILSKDRKKAKYAVTPEGLYLDKVIYKSGELLPVL